MDQREQVERRSQIERRNLVDRRDLVVQKEQIDEINLLDYWNVAWKWRSLIVLGTLICMFVAGLTSVMKTRVYKAQATFFITQKGQGGKIAQTGDRVSMIQEPSEIHGDILTQMAKSCAVAQRVIQELDLPSTWKTKRLSDCELILKKKIKIENVGPKTSGIFTFSVIDEDPQLAFRITESYLKNLQEVITQISAGTARNLLEFIEDKLVKTKDDLLNAENELRQFKMKYGITELKKQGELIVQNIADLQLEVSRTEANLGVLEKQYTGYDPEVIRTRAKIAEMKEKIRQLQGLGTGPISADDLSGKGKRPETPTIQEIPNLSMKLGELDQKVQIQNDIYKLLVVQYESAKIETTRQARVIQVIDKPMVPEDPESRKVKQNTMIAGVVGFMLTMILAFFLEYLRKNRRQILIPVDAHSLKHPETLYAK